MEITIEKLTVTSQIIFKILFPVLLIATSFLLSLSIISEEAVFSGVNNIAIGSTYLSYYFSKHAQI